MLLYFVQPGCSWSFATPLRVPGFLCPALRYRYSLRRSDRVMNMVASTPARARTMLLGMMVLGGTFSENRTTNALASASQTPMIAISRCPEVMPGAFVLRFHS